MPLTARCAHAGVHPGIGLWLCDEGYSRGSAGRLGLCLGILIRGQYGCSRSLAPAMLASPSVLLGARDSSALLSECQEKPSSPGGLLPFQRSLVFRAVRAAILLMI